MITVEPMGGLANRMRVIASAIWLKNKLGTSLTVVWNENYELNSPWQQLFEPTKLFDVISKPVKYRYVKSGDQLNNPKRLLIKLTNKLVGIDHCLKEHDFNLRILPGKLNVADIIRPHQHVYIQTCQQFIYADLDYSYFKPIAPIAHIIHQVAANFNPHTIGVHIRRTDNTQSIQYSPVELFIDAMQAQLATDPKTNYFLCSDDAQVKQTVAGIFANKVIASTSGIDRRSVTGMQDAVADMFCLAKTRKILGAYYSSYPEIAAVLGNIELMVLKSDK